MSEPRFLQVRRPEIRNVRWGHPLAYIIRALPAAIERSIQAMNLPSHPLVLDFGCAEQPYRRLLPHAAEYLGADIPGNPLADVEIALDGRVDIETGSIDLVLSTQVLEHVIDPSAYLAECARVTRPGGRLLLSTHGLMALHRDPVDYWRWTSDGLQHMVAESGFAIERFEGVMSLGATGVQFFQDATILRLPRTARRPYASVLQALAGFLDRRTSPEVRDQDAMVFVVTAIRDGA